MSNAGNVIHGSIVGLHRRAGQDAWPTAWNPGRTG